MISRTLARSIFRLALLACAFGAILLPGSPAHGSGGTLTFHATVSGKAHESGSFTHGISSQGDPIHPLVDFTGCAIIKQRTGSIFGPYIFKVQTVMIQLAGLKPAGSGVNLEVDHYRPSRSTSTYHGLTIAGTFAINGHSYGDRVGLAHAAVQIRNGGTSGTWAEPAAQRNYPAALAHPVPGFSFKATWQCTSVLHLTAQ